MTRGSNAPIRRSPTPSPAPTQSSNTVTLKRIWVFPRALQWVEQDRPRQLPGGFSVDCRMSMRPEQRIEYVVVVEVTFHRTGIYEVHMVATRSGTEIVALTKDEPGYRAEHLTTQTLMFEHFAGPLFPEFTVRFERVGDLPPTLEESIDDAKVAAEAVKQAQGELADALAGAQPVKVKESDAKPR